MANDISCLSEDEEMSETNVAFTVQIADLVLKRWKRNKHAAIV